MSPVTSLRHWWDPAKRGVDNGQDARPRKKTGRDACPAKMTDRDVCDTWGPKCKRTRDGSVPASLPSGGNTGTEAGATMLGGPHGGE